MIQISLEWLLESFDEFEGETIMVAPAFNFASGMVTNQIKSPMY
jgi:hypothetical protein